MEVTLDVRKLIILLLLLIPTGYSSSSTSPELLEWNCCYWNLKAASDMYSIEVFFLIKLWIVIVILYFPLNKSGDTISTLLLIFENKLLSCIWEHTCIHRHKENFGLQRTLYCYFFHFPPNKYIDISTFFWHNDMPNKEWVVRYSEILQFYVCVIREYRWIWKENALSLKIILILLYGWKLTVVVSYWEMHVWPLRVYFVL